MKDFIPYTEALALKELGFDEECFGFYNPTITKNVIINNDSYGGFGLMQDHIVVAPTYSQAFKWFRKKYQLRVWVEWGSEHLCCAMIQCSSGLKQLIDAYSTDEEAELACLRKLIEIVKNK